jgi:hypothetical protein
MDASTQEIKSLLEYLVKHNADHAGEIMELAERAQILGNQTAYQHIAQGVRLLNESNESLKAGLAALEV